jgi:hypothetical protein
MNNHKSGVKADLAKSRSGIADGGIVKEGL